MSKHLECHSGTCSVLVRCWLFMLHVAEDHSSAEKPHINRKVIVNIIAFGSFQW